MATALTPFSAAAGYNFSLLPLRWFEELLRVLLLIDLSQPFAATFAPASLALSNILHGRL